MPKYIFTVVVVFVVLFFLHRPDCCKKMHCFQGNITLLTKILHDRRLRWSRQISTLVSHFLKFIFGLTKVEMMDGYVGNEIFQVLKYEN